MQSIARSNSSTQLGLVGRSIQTVRRRILDRFVLRPTKHELPYAPKQRELIHCGEFAIECFVQSFVAPGEAPDLLVIKFPGTAGRAERATDFPRTHLPAVGSEIWTWNPPGYGGSVGRASLTTIPQAATALFQNISARFDLTKTRIWLVGNSLGCVTAGYLASREPSRIAGLILRNPPPLVEIVKRVARRYPLGHLTDSVSESLPPEMNLLVTAQHNPVPTVMFQSEQDELVPPSSQMKVFEALPGPKRIYVMRGLGHGGIPSEDQEIEMRPLIQWLWEQHETNNGTG